MKRLLLFLTVLLAFLLVGCEPTDTGENTAYEELWGTEMFDIYEIERINDTDRAYILVDKKTDVMYLYTVDISVLNSGTGVGTTMTVMLDADGTPLLWSEYELMEAHQ